MFINEINVKKLKQNVNKKNKRVVISANNN